MTLRRGQVRPRLFEVKELADAPERFARGSVLGDDGGLPQFAPAVALIQSSG